jgi:hypothetical protein
LDISWDDLRFAICSLLPIIGTDQAKIRALMRFVGEHHLSEPSIATLSSDLARGCIRVLKDVVSGRQPKRVIWYEGFVQIFGSLIFLSGIVPGSGAGLLGLPHRPPHYFKTFVNFHLSKVSSKQNWMTHIIQKTTTTYYNSSK